MNYTVQGQRHLTLDIQLGILVTILVVTIISSPVRLALYINLK